MQREVEIETGTVGWLPAQQHHGENIGETPTHVVFVELKSPTSGSEEASAAGGLGPQ
jgi:hypothetical protein